MTSRTDSHIGEHRFIAFVVLACTVASIALILHVPTFRGDDSPGYLVMRDAWLHGHSLLHAIFTPDRQRLPLVPLLFLVFPSDQAAKIALSLLSLAAWSSLGLATLGLLRSATLRRLGLLVILSGAYAANVFTWHAFVLSESLSITTIVALVAALLAVLRNPSLRTELCFFAIAVASVLTRESNIFLVPLFAVPLLARLRGGVGPRIIFVATLLACAGAWVDSVRHDRSTLHMSMINNLDDRIVTDPAALAFFKRHGLPDDPSLAACANKFLWTCPPSPVLDAWTEAHAKGVYTRWLLATFPQRAVKILRDPVGVLDLYGANKAVVDLETNSSPEVVGYLRFFSPFNYPSIFLLALSMAAALSAARVPDHRREALGLLWALMCLGTNIFVCYWGDSSDVQRHCLPTIIGMEAICATLLLIGLDLVATNGSAAMKARNALDVA